MSTVLDALAKAEKINPEEGGPGSPLPAGGPPPPPRGRWKVAAFVVLVLVAFTVGLFSDDDAEISDPSAELAEAPSTTAAQLQRIDRSEAPVAARLPTEGDPRSGIPAGDPPVAPRVAQKVPQSAKKPPAGRPAVAQRPKGAVEGAEGAEAAREARRLDRQKWKEKRMAARDAAREARAKAVKGEISRDEYRDQRLRLRQQDREEREAHQAERRAEQAERRLALGKRAEPVRAGATRNPYVESAQPAAAAPEPVVGSDSDGGAAPAAVVSPEAKTDPAPVAAVEIAQGAPAEPPQGHGLEIRRWVPAGAPPVRIQILQWSRDDERRFAFLSVDGGRATRVQEGGVVGPLEIKTIYREMIEIGFNGNSFLLRAN